MREEEARETIIHEGSLKLIKDKAYRLEEIVEEAVIIGNKFNHAKGYLEALKKAEPLVDALKLAPCKCSPPNDLVCERCQALAQYEAEK
jgi:hypothetical protein